MIKIRLARFGKKKRPVYRFIVSDSKKDTLGTYLENLGHYDPHAKVCDVKKDRVLYWVGVGAQMSPTVHNLLVDQKVIDKQKVKAFTPKKKEGGEEEAAAPAPAEASEKPAETTEAPAEENKDAAPAEEPKKEEAPAEEKSEEVKEEPVAEEKLAESAPEEEDKEETPAEEKTEEDKKE